MRRILLLAFFVLSALTTAFAQSTPQTGVYKFGAFDTPGFDTINRGNLNVHLTIPIFSKPGRGGTNFGFALNYDSIVWTPSTLSGGGAWQPAAAWGWTPASQVLSGYVSHMLATIPCSGSSFVASTYSNYIYHDQVGKTHPIELTRRIRCGSSELDPSSGTATVLDNSGYTFYYNGDSMTAFSPGGGQYSVAQSNSAPPGISGSYVDTNGNTITASSSGVFTDTLGETVLTVTGSGTASSPVVYSYPVVGGSSNATVTVKYTNYNIATNFALNNISQYSATGVPLISSIVYSGDNSQYTFTYEATPGQSGYVTGRVASITLRTGGTISYAYTGGTNGIEADGSASGITRTTSDGSTTYTRSGVSSTASSTNFTDASGNVSTSTFLEDSIGYLYETSHSTYSGAASGTPLQAVTTCYSSCSSPSVAAPISTIITSLAQNGISVASTTNTYSGGLQTSATDGFFTTTSTYQTFTGADSIDFSRLLSNKVTDSSGTQVGLTTYGYDAGTLKASGFSHNANVTTSRGNLTSVSPWLNTTKATFGATSIVNYDTGSQYQSTTPNGTTTYTYNSTTFYQNGTQLPTPSSGVSLAAGITSDSSTGLPTTSSDLNSNSTNFSSYDSMLRPLEVDYPDGGITKVVYRSPNQTSTQALVTGSTYSDLESLVDGYGRTSRVAQANGQGTKPWYQQDTCYDDNGRTSFRAYSYAGTGFGPSPVCSGAGDTFTYDALGRVTKVLHGDNTAANYSYFGRATKVSDELGVQRISQIDGHGRIVSVCEVTSVSLQGAAPVSCGQDIAATGFLTTYAYTTGATGNQVTTVTQGAQTRVFQTDSLGRTVSVQEPESGTTSYAYSYVTSPAVGLQVTRTKPQANQSSASQTTTTTTSYDSVGRVVSVSYTDGTPTKQFNYDAPVAASSEWSSSEKATQTNLKGQLSLHVRVEGSATSSSMYGYDTMGRVKWQWSCFPTGCGSNTYDKGIVYTYNSAGMLTAEGDGAGNTYTYNRSEAGELTGITSAVVDNTDPSSIMSSVVNGPNGPTSYSLGNGLNVNISYDSLGRNSGYYLCQGSISPANASCSGSGETQLYGYQVGWTGQYANGNCDTIVNLCNTFSYDAFGRISARTVTQGATQNYTYSYDRYGNRWSQTPLNGGSTSNLSYTASNNTINESGFANDAAGNITNDGQHTYKYDADGNVTNVDSSGTGYLYDSLNNRTQLVDTTGGYALVYDIFGRRVSEFNAWNYNDFLEAEAYSDRGLIAHRTAGSPQSTHFDHANYLGSMRARTSYSGAVEATISSLPWGDGYTLTGTSTDRSDFASLDLDADGTEHAGARNYANLFGRWLSPDPYMGSYDFTNPQSFNRYSYVLNNPVSFIDPSGLDCVFYQDNGRPQSASDAGYSTDDTNPQQCGSDGGQWVDGSIDWSTYPYYYDTSTGSWIFSSTNSDGSSTTTYLPVTIGTSVSVTVNAGSGMNLTGIFNLGGITVSQFIQEMTSAGVPVSPWDTANNKLHNGTQLRSASTQYCGLHVTIDPGSGQDGSPVTGNFHLDLYNPVKLSGTSLDPIFSVIHGAFDVIPDEIQNIIPWFPTGNQQCPYR